MEPRAPAGIVPVNISPSIQEMLSVVSDQDVSQTQPFKLVPKAMILDEIQEHKGDSVFRFAKDEVLNYPEDDILISYDPFFKYGENYFMCLTEEAKKGILYARLSEDELFELTSEDVSSEKPIEELLQRLPKSESKRKIEKSQMELIAQKADSMMIMEEDIAEDEGEGGLAVGEEEGGEFQLVEYIPPESKPWESLGSEADVEDEQIRTRRKLQIWYQKPFLHHRPSQLKLNFKHPGDSKLGITSCPPYDDPNFLQTIELDKGCQATAIINESQTQTEYLFPKAAASQTKPREMEVDEANAVIESPELLKFLQFVTPRMEFMLQQNQIHDVFYNDWAYIGKGDIIIHSKSSTQVKEYQSLSDLQYSKDKMITGIDWHPSMPGILAVACADRMSFDMRIDKASRLFMRRSLILLWSLKDPINPQLMLEAPDEVRSIKFNPTIGNLLVAGCINGQIALWDLANYMEHLKTQRPIVSITQTTKGQEYQFVDPPPLIPSVRYCASSSIEHGHRNSVEHVDWVPDHLEILKMGMPQEGKLGLCVQIISCSMDCMIFVWDIRKGKQPAHDAKTRMREKELTVGIPATFQFLDAVWKPIHWVDLWNTEKTKKLLPLKFSLQEAQLYKPDTTDITDMQVIIDLENSLSDPSLEIAGRLSTKIFVGTMDTGIAVVNWLHEKDSDGKLVSHAAEFTLMAHGGMVVAVEYSPFFRNIVLTVGLWKFCIWKEELKNKPLMEATSPDQRMMTGKWSISRPSVFYIAKQDGTVDIWDLNDRSDEPSITHTVSAIPITTLAFHPHPQNVRQRMLAAGDVNGNLHLLILPPYLLKPAPNEIQKLVLYFSGEQSNMLYRGEKITEHLTEKDVFDRADEAKKAYAYTPTTIHDPESQEEEEFHKFKKDEKTILISLGIEIEEEPQEQDAFGND